MTEENKKNQRPDAVPASLSVGAVEPKYKKGDHVWAKQPKELAGRTGYVRAVDTYRMVYEVAFGTEMWKMLEDDLELVDPATEEARQTVFEREDDTDHPQVEAQEEKETPDNFKYNIGDIIKVADPEVNLWSPANPDKQYHDNLRVIFRFFDGNHVYIVEAEDGICLVITEQQTELVERSTQPNTPPDNMPEPDPQAKTVTQDEYFREVSTLNGKIRELEQKLSAEQQKNSKQKEDTVEFLRKSEACLDAVSAMLECSGGATHRMRDFYADAMQKFIGNAKKILRSYADPLPF